MTRGSAEAEKAQETSARDSVEPSGAAKPTDPGLPRMLTDRYRLERLIAKGGMGRVYLATQLPLERRVALKHLVRPSLNDDFRKRFFLEASVLAKLSHPNIVVVHDYGEAPDGSLFMAMEYLDGVTLLDTLRREGRLTAVRACEIAGQVCRALRSAHKQGVAHRDLKPGNIMLLRDKDSEDDEPHRDIVKVLDFGLVKVFQEDEDNDVERDLTRAEMMLGSPRYMAPEQIQCDTVDARADVYSMGVVLFAMLTGRPPFVGTTLEILNQHLEAPVPGLNELTQELKGFNAVNPDVEPVLNGIIQKCMEKSPDARYQSMDELLLELRTAYRLLTDDSLDTPSALELSHPSMNPVLASGSLSGDSSHQRLRANIAPPEDAETGASSVSMAPVLPVEEQRPRSKRWIFALLALLCLGLGVAAYLLMPAPETPPGQPETPPGERASNVTEPTPVPVPPTKVTFTSEPPGATVSRGDQVLGVTPLERELEPTDDVVTFSFRLEGHEPATVETRIDGERQTVHAPLAAVETGEPPATPTKTGAVAASPASPRPGGRPAVKRAPARGPTPSKQPLPQARAKAPTAPEPPAAAEPERPTPPPARERPRFIVEEPRGAVPIVD